MASTARGSSSDGERPSTVDTISTSYAASNYTDASRTEPGRSRCLTKSSERSGYSETSYCTSRIQSSVASKRGSESHTCSNQSSRVTTRVTTRTSVRSEQDEQQPKLKSAKDRTPTPRYVEAVQPARRPICNKFSSRHPMIPKRYVPPWQLDMKNRGLTIENCKKAEINTWEGHISHFLNGRERVGITKSTPYEFLNEDRQLNATTSHLSNICLECTHRKWLIYHACQECAGKEFS